MLANRSIPAATVIRVLAYRDVHEAAAWLCEAFGFSVRLRISDHRVQLNAGEGAVTVREMRGSAAAQAPAPTGLRQHGRAFGATLSARLK